MQKDIIKISHYSQAFVGDVSGAIVICNYLNGAICRFKPEDFSTFQDFEIILSEEVLCAGFFCFWNSKKEIEHAYRFLKNQWQRFKTDPTIVIVPTFECNCECPYCYQDKKTLTRILNDKETQFIYNYLMLNGIKKFLLYGGEPLSSITKNWVNSFFENYRDIKSINVSAITNGVSLDEFERWLGNPISYVQITLDGFEKTHNSRRPARDRSINAWERILKNIAMAIEKNVHVEIRMNFDRSNLKECKHLKNKLEMMYSGNKNFSVYSHPAFNVPKSVLWSPAKSCGDEKNDINYVPDPLRYYLQSLENGTPFIPPFSYCATASKGGQLIFAPGGVWNCWGTAGDINVKHAIYDINDINSKLIPGKSIFSSTFCKECKFLPLCGGGCPKKTFLGEDLGCSSGEERKGFTNEIAKVIGKKYKDIFNPVDIYVSKYKHPALSLKIV